MGEEMNMDAARFRTLAAAYGADPRRWPQAEREAAAAFAAVSPEEAERALEAERGLDALLDAAPAAVPSAQLREAVIASAPRPRAVRRHARGWFLLPGAGLAAACAAGALVGGVLAQHAVLDSRADSVLVAGADANDADIVGLS
jgi:hypothetical protein